MDSLQAAGLAVKRLQWHHHREGNRRLFTVVGLSLVQWDVLRHLHRHPDASLHDVAVATFQTDQSMGELARRMVDRGLIARVEGPGRAIRHRVTQTGRTAFEQGSGVFDAVLEETVGNLTVAERATLVALVEKSLGTGDPSSP